MNTALPELASDLTLLRDAVLDAGKIARHYFERGFETYEKAKDDFVTDADLAIDKALRERLIRERPTYGWLSEESENDLHRLDCKRVWVVDPIDGTYGFVHRIPNFTICAALVEDGLPVIGIVLNPITENLYEALVGNGATLNRRTIAVSSTSALENARVIAVRSKIEDPKWERKWPNMRIDMPTSFGQSLSVVATGEFDLLLSLANTPITSEWDLAAADLIIREAGGMVTDQQGRNFRYNQENPLKSIRTVIASCPGLFSEVMGRCENLPRFG